MKRSKSSWGYWSMAVLTVGLGLSIPVASDSRAAYGQEDDAPVVKKTPIKKPLTTKVAPKKAQEAAAEVAEESNPDADEKPAAAKPALKLTPALKTIIRRPTVVAPVQEANEEAVEPKAEADSPKSKLPVETPTHEQVATIAINQQKGPACSLNTFCLTPDGKIIAAVSTPTASPRTLVRISKPVAKSEDSAEGETESSTKESTAKTPKQLGELRLFDADGKALSVWPLEINPTAVNVGPDGEVYVAGSGKVLKLDGKGQVVLSVDSPNTKDLTDNREAIIKELEAQSSGGITHRSKDVYVRAIEQAKKRIAELEEKEATAKKEEKELTRAEKVRLTSARRSLQSLEEQLEQLKEPTESEKKAVSAQKEAQINEMLEYKKRISGIAVTDKDVFVACSSAVGWGYDVWHLERDLTDGKKIVQQLRGCCGQMDIQARGDNLVVAENSMHRVSCYDRTGKLVKNFGDRESISKLGFEGCCNPMNCRVGAEGEIYTSESSIGRIRKFSAKGEYIGLVGQAKLVSGCKHVAVAVSSDGDKVYLLDVTKGEILVMAKKPQVKTAAK